MASVHKSVPHAAAARSFSLPAPDEQAICAKLLLCLGAIGSDYLLSPALYNGSTLWATAALLLLVFRRGQAPGSDAAGLTVTKLSAGRLAVFLALHAVIIAIGRYSVAAFTSAAASDAGAAALLAAAKLLILLPGIVLFTRSDWPLLLRRYRAEFLAALIVLFTFFPYRLFHTIWPEYSQVIATLAYYGAKPFVAGLGFSSLPIPTILGPQLNLQIIFWCSGFSALAMFDTLVALVAVLDWNELNHKRLLIAYFAGAFAILVANVVRISLLVIIGNLIAPKYAMGRFHVNAGWVFFALVYLLILAISYRWMLRTAPQSAPRS
ncbi:MAG: exosortase/archaeosortase family protein [Candidatus Acidiferrales bacterium]